MRADFSNKKLKSLLSGAKQIFKTSVLPLRVRSFPHVSSGCSLDETNSPLICENSTCIILKLGLALRFFIYRQCGQYSHNLCAIGNGSHTSHMASTGHYRCRSYTFRHGTWAIWQSWGLSIKAFSLLSSIWSKKTCSLYHISVSVPYSLLHAKIVVLFMAIKPIAKETCC